MACKINWTSRAWQSFEANVEYLQREWTFKEVSNFVASTDKKIAIIANQPKIGKSRDKKHPNLRFVVIHKRVALIYKHKPQRDEIDLLVFWNTHRNPGKLKFK